MNTMYGLLISFAEVFAAMSPWLVIGFLAAGVIAVWIPRSWVNRVMGGSSGFSECYRVSNCKFRMKFTVADPVGSAPIVPDWVLPAAAGFGKMSA